MNAYDLYSFFTAIENAYTDGQLNSALEIAEKAYIELPENKDDTLYWKACLYAINNKHNEALQCFEEALSNNIWWAPNTLDFEQDLKSLHKNVQFLNYVNIMKKEYEKKQAQSTPLRVDFLNSNALDYIVNLHWKNDSISNYRKFFDGIYIKHAINCIYIQSSQVASSVGYCWDDKEKGIREIEALLSSSINNVDTFCGTSQGGVIALMLSIKYSKNYIGVMPVIRDLAIIDQIQNSKAKYRFIIGKKDNHYQSIKEIDKILNQKGLDSKFIDMGSIGHTFPKNFQDYYEKALA